MKCILTAWVGALAVAWAGCTTSVPKVPATSGSGSSGGTSGTTGTGSTSGSAGSTSSGTSGSTGTTGTTGEVDAGPPCGGPCAAGQFCDNPSDQCKPIYEVTLLAPAAGSWFDGGGGEAVIQVMRNRGDAGVPDSVWLDGPLGPGSRSFTATPVDGGVWTVSWTPGAAEGTYAMEGHAMKGVDAYTSGMVMVNVDQTAPTVTLSLGTPSHPTADPALDGGGYFRDEAPIPLTLTAVDNAGGVGNVTVSMAGSAQAGIEQLGLGYQLNLQMLPLDGGNGTYQLTATATDGVGNVSTAQPVGFAVTRWKWVADTQSGAVDLVAVDRSGMIYAEAAAVPGSIHNVFQISSDGGTVWGASVAHNPKLPPAMEPDGGHLFVAQSNGDVTLVNVADGSDAGTVTLDSQINAMALGEAPEPVAAGGADVPAVFITSSTKKLFGVEDYFALASSTPYVFTGVNASIARGVYADGSTVHFGLQGSSNNPTLSADTTTVSVNQTVFVPGNDVSLVEAISLGPVASSQDVFFGSEAGGHLLGHVDLSGSSPAESPAALTFANSVTSEMVIDGTRSAYVAVGTNLVKKVSVMGSSGTLSFNPINGPSGVGADVGMLLATTHLYALGSAGTVVALPTASFGTSEWSVDVSVVGNPSAPPSLICSSQGESLLLVPTDQGKLVALVIDDAGLDATAAWPKARHDLFNSANIQTPITACPQ